MLCRIRMTGGLLAAALACTPQAQVQAPGFALAQPRFALAVDQFLHPAFPFDLVAAAQADRIAWLANERGQRNVYTAAAPDFTPVRARRRLPREVPGGPKGKLMMNSTGTLISSA
jgi:hypothetical protein